MERTDSKSAMMLLQYESDEDNEQESPVKPTEKKKSPEKRRHSSGKDSETLSPSRRISEDSFGRQTGGFISDEEIDHHLPDRSRKREHEEEEEDEESGPPPAKMAVADVSHKVTPSVSPVEIDSSASDHQRSKKKSSRPTMRLVSYGTDDLDEEENESEEDSEEESSSDKEEIVNEEGSATPGQVIDADSIQLPPAPPGKCSKALQDKISALYDRMKKEGIDTNYEIQRLTSFRNPSIYEKLIQTYHIDEKGSNFKLDVFNPHIWGKDSYYDELDKAQKKDMERREKERKTKIEFVSGTKKSAPSSDRPSSGGTDEKKRKSKWDALPAGLPQMHRSGSSGSNMANLTTTATGTRATVISAVGTLTKKAPYSIINSSGPYK